MLISHLGFATLLPLVEYSPRQALAEESGLHTGSDFFFSAAVYSRDLFRTKVKYFNPPALKPGHCLRIR
jgi:hypothetical protein